MANFNTIVSWVLLSMDVLNQAYSTSLPFRTAVANPYPRKRVKKSWIGPLSTKFVDALNIIAGCHLRVALA